MQGGFPRGVLPRRWGPNPLPPLWSCALLGMFLSFLLGCIPTHLHRHQEGSGCVSDPTFRLQRVRGNPSCAPPARGLSDTDPNEHAKSINPFWLIGSCAARSRSRDHRTCRGFAAGGGAAVGATTLHCAVQGVSMQSSLCCSQNCILNAAGWRCGV